VSVAILAQVSYDPHCPSGAMAATEPQTESLKLSDQKMGGLPQELQPTLKKIDDTPLSIHEAATMGDLKAVQEYLEVKKQPLDVQDQKGITPLGYAIGANRIAEVKLLLDKRANGFHRVATVRVSLWMLGSDALFC
jgi:ankyrin repeat protein